MTQQASERRRHLDCELQALSGNVAPVSAYIFCNTLLLQAWSQLAGSKV